MVLVAIGLVLLAGGNGYRADLSTAAGYNVRCQPLAGDIAGAADLRQREVLLAPATCRGFNRKRHLLDSLHTLSHERQHLLGVTDEQEADCEGLWDVRWLGRRLGYHITRKALYRYAGTFYAPCVA